MSVIDEMRAYCWILDNRQLQLLLMQLNMKGNMQLAKLVTALPEGLVVRVLNNISSGARKNLEEELSIVKNKVTLESQELAAEIFVQILHKLMQELVIQLPEVVKTLAYINGESPLLFKDEGVTSRKQLESWIMISNPDRLKELLLQAKVEFGLEYLHAIMSISKEYRKYLLPYVEPEDYEVLVNSFTKDTFNTLRPTQVIHARQLLMTLLAKAYEGKGAPSGRDLVYQGAVLNQQWWQERLEWELLQEKLSDDQLRQLLMNYPKDEVVLVYYESPKKLRDRLFSLFTETVNGILRFIYQEMDTQGLGEAAHSVRKKMVAAAAKLV